MKKLVYFVLAALLLAACKPQPEPVKVTAITITPNEVELEVNETKKLSAKLTPEDATETVEWSSSDVSIATVDSKGVVTAVAVGEAEITAKAGEVSAKATVRVLSIEQAIKIADWIVLQYQSTAPLLDNWGYPYSLAGVTDGVEFAGGDYVGAGYIFEFIVSLEIVDNKLQQSILGDYQVYDGNITAANCSSTTPHYFEKGLLVTSDDGLRIDGSWMYGADADGSWPIGAIEGVNFNFGLIGEDLGFLSYTIRVNLLDGDDTTAWLSGEYIEVSKTVSAAVQAKIAQNKMQVKKHGLAAVNKNNVLIRK